MRVLQLNHADLVGGGAAIAGYRLHRSLRAAGVDSRLCVGTKVSDDPTVEVLHHPRRTQRVLGKVGRELGLNELSGVGSYALARSSDVAAADVVHAHAVHGGWFSYPALVRLTRQTPTLMTLHDMWPFTGHCSFAYECTRWQTGCGHCPHPETFPAVARDATALEWRLKRTVWRRSRLTLITPSRWLADQVTASTMGHSAVHHIPHGIDHHVFAPRDRGPGRSALGIPDGNLTLMFAASSLAAADGGEIDRKGGDLLVAALEGMAEPDRCSTSLVLMGVPNPALVTRLRGRGFHVVDAGYVSEESDKAALYAAADLFVFPTRADNAPLVILEAMACGTPVASFDVGGVGEMVRSGLTGYLVPPEDVPALRDALTAGHRDRDALRAMGLRARAVVEADHSEALAVERHLRLYQEVA